MINSLWNMVTGASSPGSPGRSRPRTTSPRLIKPNYSLSYLQDQIDELISVTGKPDSPRASVPAASTDRLVELIRAIAETLLWGEQNEEDSLMFDYFAEKGVMKIFVTLLNTPTIPPSSSLFTASSSGNRQIKIQLLQTMSLLLLNVKRQTSLYFLFSNNAVNQLINNTNNLDFSDEEILSYYVSLMKSISLRLSGETIQFFINDKNANYFPLFSQSIRFFDHHDRMVRIAVRTITLTIFKLHAVSEGLQKFLTDNTGGYFSLLACQLRDLWFLMDRTVADGTAAASTLPLVTDEMVDQLEHLAEIERLDIPPLSELLWAKLNIYAVEGVLVPSLLGIPDGSRSPRIEEAAAGPAKNLSQPLAVFVTIQLMDVFRLNAVTEPILSKFVSQDKSWIEKDLKQVGKLYSLLIVLFDKLVTVSAGSESLRNGVSEFGLLPPSSIQLILLIAQSLGKAPEYLSEKSLILTTAFLESYLSRPAVSADFKRPIILTITDSFKNVSLRISQLLGEGLLKSGAAANDMDYSIIDLVERVLVATDPAKLHLSQDELNRISSDVNLITPVELEWKQPDLPLSSLSEETVRKFLILARFVKSMSQAEFMLTKTHSELFEEPEDGPSEPINSPPTPPPEFIDAESIATDIKGEAESAEAQLPLPPDTVEGATIDLGRRDRIVCTHISSPLGRSTRYLLVDKWRLILVAPDITRPGFANIKLLVPLRTFATITVSREDQRILILESAAGAKEQLGFDDVKRCHLALMHLETRRIDIRKAIYFRIETFLKSFILS